MMGHFLGGERCAACDRIAPDGPAVVASVAGVAVAYLCAACPPWDEGENFRAFEAAVRARYTGLPVRFAFWPALSSLGHRAAAGGGQLLAARAGSDAR